MREDMQEEMDEGVGVGSGGTWLHRYMATSLRSDERHAGMAFLRSCLGASLHAGPEEPALYVYSLPWCVGVLALGVVTLPG